VPKKDLDWLIETAEQQVQGILQDLENDRLEPRDKRSQRAILIQAIASLQKLYLQAGIVKGSSTETWEDQLGKIPETRAKRG
jgi:hypothetical protein